MSLDIDTFGEIMDRMIREEDVQILIEMRIGRVTERAVRIRTFERLAALGTISVFRSLFAHYASSPAVVSAGSVSNSSPFSAAENPSGSQDSSVPICSTEE